MDFRELSSLRLLINYNVVLTVNSQAGEQNKSRGNNSQTKGLVLSMRSSELTQKTQQCEQRNRYPGTAKVNTQDNG